MNVVREIEASRSSATTHQEPQRGPQTSQSPGTPQRNHEAPGRSPFRAPVTGPSRRRPPKWVPDRPYRGK